MHKDELTVNEEGALADLIRGDLSLEFKPIRFLFQTTMDSIIGSYPISID